MDRSRRRAWLGTLVFLVIAPGVVGGLVPWLLTGWKAGPMSSPLIVVAGAVLVVAGVAILLDAFVRFAVQGVGTPAPIAPTRNLVVTGPYRFVRNPMYLAVLAIIVGQALILASWTLAGYGAAVAVAFALFVTGYEEPALSRQFGAQYERYRAAVPGWWPRLRHARPIRRPGTPDSDRP